MHRGEFSECRSPRAGSPERHTGAGMDDLLRRLRCAHDDFALQRRAHGRAQPIAILARVGSSSLMAERDIGAEPFVR
jgi:hypothetical protein